MNSDESGSAAVLTVVMLPLLLIALTGALEFGALRAVAHRVSTAADLATLVAVNDQDESVHVLYGSVRPARDAEQVARQYFALNLAASANELAASVDTIASAADIAVYATAPSVDARTGATYDRPTVRIVASVPVRTPAFGLLLLPTVTTITVRAASSVR